MAAKEFLIRAMHPDGNKRCSFIALLFAAGTLCLVFPGYQQDA
jgi:hypothetical protein